MKLTLFSNIDSRDKSHAIDELVKHSFPSQSFYFMILLSFMMAAFGALTSNIPVLIGSMLIAPMLYPVISLSMGIVMSDSDLMQRSAITLLKSVGLGLGVAMMISLFFASLIDLDMNVVQRLTRPSLIDGAVAVIAGVASSFAIVKRELNESLPGVAIAVALVPPLAVSGVGLGMFNWAVASGAFITFIVNILGIVFASSIVFSVMNFYTKRSEVHEEIEKNERKEEAPEVRGEI